MQEQQSIASANEAANRVDTCQRTYPQRSSTPVAGLPTGEMQMLRPQEASIFRFGVGAPPRPAQLYFCLL